MKRKLLVLSSVLVVAVAIVAILAMPVAEAKKPGPPVPCEIVYCPAPDCPAGTKPVILPGDCCFSCIPTK